jgi:ribosomal protein L29
MAKKKTTLETLAKTIDALAAMTKRSFDDLRSELREEIGFTRKELKTDIAKLRAETKAGFAETNERLGYHRADIDNLTHRVKRLEKFTGIDK